MEEVLESSSYISHMFRTKRLIALDLGKHDIDSILEPQNDKGCLIGRLWIPELTKENKWQNYTRDTRFIFSSGKLFWLFMLWNPWLSLCLCSSPSPFYSLVLMMLLAFVEKICYEFLCILHVSMLVTTLSQPFKPSFFL